MTVFHEKDQFADVTIALSKEREAKYRWLRGSNLPSVDNLYALSRFLKFQWKMRLLKQQHNAKNGREAICFPPLLRLLTRPPTRNVLNHDLHMHGRFGNAEMLRRVTDGGAVFDDVHSKLLRSCLEIFFHVGTSKLCMLQHPMPANSPVYALFPRPA